MGVKLGQICGSLAEVVYAADWKSVELGAIPRGTTIKKELIMKTKQKCYKILDEFKTLEKNWNSYDANPPSLASIEKGKEICDLLIDNNITDFGIFPGNNRTSPSGVSIQLEINEKFIDIDLYDSSVKIFTSKNENYSLVEFSYNTNYKDKILESLK